MGAIQQMLLSQSGSGDNNPPNYADVLEWWDNRDSDFAISGSDIDTWTGRKAAYVLTGTTTTRPQKLTVAGENYVHFAADYFDMDTGFTIDRRNSCVFMIVRRAIENTNTESLFHMGTSSTTHAVYYVGNELRFYNASTRSTGRDSGSGFNAIAANASAANVDMYMLPEAVSAVTASAAGTIADGYFGQWNTGVFRFQGGVKMLLVYNRTLTTPEIEAVQDWMTEYYRAADRATSIVRVYEGDSITYGTSSTRERDYSYPAQIASTETVERKYCNVATGGATLQSNVAATRVITQLGNNSAITTRTVIVCFGSNDINNGRTAAQIETDYGTWDANIAAADSGAVIIGCTVTPRADFSAAEEIERVALNVWIMAGGGGIFTHVVDFAADARLDDPNDGTYYADGIHHTDAGYAVRAELVKAVLEANNK